MNSEKKTVSVAGLEQGDVSTKMTLKPYEKPVLLCYGDVRDVTLGPTFGQGESGCAGFRKVGNGGCS